MLDSPRRIIRNDLQLKLNIDTGRGKESEGKAKLSNPLKTFGDDCMKIVQAVFVLIISKAFKIKCCRYV